MSKEIENLRTRFETLIEAIDKANEYARQGHVAPLHHLDDAVQILCRDLKQANPIMAQEVEPLMAKMISGLDELEQNLAMIRNQKPNA
jgi:hypothetical protein